MPLRGLFENLDCRVESAMQKQLTTPVEKIVFAGGEVRRGLELSGRGYEVAVLLLDLREQVMQLGSVLQFDQGLHGAPCVFQTASDEIRDPTFTRLSLR